MFDLLPQKVVVVVFHILYFNINKYKSIELNLETLNKCPAGSSTF